MVWWLLLGVLLMGLAIMVGMDMGVGTILRYVGRTDTERRVALNIVGPHWDGNQVWFILGGGAIFAAWPWSMPRHFRASTWSCSCCSGA